MTRFSPRERLQQKLKEIKTQHVVTNQDRHQRKLKQQLKKTDKKKQEKNDLKQKLMKVGKGAGNKSKLKVEVDDGGATPGTGKTEKVIFSKFDFSSSEVLPDQPKRKANDPKAALAKIALNKEKMESMIEKGLTDKVKRIESKAAWATAIDKAEGVKVKDDVELLKKSLKKQEQKKRSSKKKWEERAENVEKKMGGRQEKRKDNLQKRKKDVKENKKKKSVKSGRLIPGA